MSDSYIARKKIVKKTYLMHNNGAQPFKVIVTARSIIILAEGGYEIDEEDEEIDEDEMNDCLYSVFVKEIDEFEGYWYGFDTSDDEEHGNSLLVKISEQKYMHIGSQIYTFKTKDKIIDYVSPLGRNDVPYPVAKGTSNIYFMLDSKYIRKKNLRKMTAWNAMQMYRDFYDSSKDIQRDMRNVELIADGRGWGDAIIY